MVGGEATVCYISRSSVATDRFMIEFKQGATAPKYRCQSEITDIFPALLAHKMHLITDWYSTKHNDLVSEFLDLVV